MLVKLPEPASPPVPILATAFAPYTAPELIAEADALSLPAAPPVPPGDEMLPMLTLPYAPEDVMLTELANPPLPPKPPCACALVVPPEAVAPA